MRFEPQCAGPDDWINTGIPPPRGFVAAVMHLAMVSTTQWDGELIADLAAKGPALGKSEVVGIRGSATANQTRVLGDSFDVVSVTNPTWFRKAQHALINCLGSRATFRLPCARSR